MSKRDIEFPLWAEVVLWVVVVGVTHFLYLLFGYFLGLWMGVGLVGTSVKYVFSVGLPMFAFYVLVFSRSGLSDRTAAVLMLMVVLFVPLIFGISYFCFDCLRMNGESSLDDAVYFSFVTFSTLGYGDITVKVECRPLAVSESIYGLLSIAGLVTLITRVLDGQR